MTNLNWTKCDRGYAAGDYVLARTVGKRWTVWHKDILLADGKQYSKLADAKQVAEDHRTQFIAGVIATAAGIAASMTPEQAQTGMAEVMGVMQRPVPIELQPKSDFEKSMPFVGGSVMTAPQVKEGDYRSDPTPPMRAFAPSTVTATPLVVSIVSSSLNGYESAAVLTEQKSFCRPVPRESLTDQFTRLYFYADIGIRRAYQRESA